MNAQTSAALADSGDAPVTAPVPESATRPAAANLILKSMIDDLFIERIIDDLSIGSFLEHLFIDRVIWNTHRCFFLAVHSCGMCVH